LWGPLGAEADASWSLDSNSSGFEKMESGFNARAVDFARFGLLFLNKGVVDGKQVVPEQWVDDATKAINTNDPNEGYKYFWRLYPNNQFAAAGNKGQYVLVAPDQQTVIVRLGSKEPSALLPLLADLALKFDTAGE
jgi:CubicO group peptidase (beta-lactamase class C family)